MSFVLKDLKTLYEYQFGGRPYVIQEQAPNVTERTGSPLTAEYLGREIWLPIKFVDLNVDVFGTSELLLPYTTIQMSVKKTIAKTSMSERKGTVKELYSVDDWSITIKGFVIDEERIWPEDELTILKKLNDLTEAVKLDNALSNIFLDNDTRVVIEDLELPEVKGGGKHIRPFTFKLESDSIFDLEF